MDKSKPRESWVCVTTQSRANELIPYLLRKNGVTRCVLIVPREPINVAGWLGGMPAHEIHAANCDGSCFGNPRVDHVTVSGETGPHARPMHPNWVRQIRDQCVAAEVPFTFAGWGEWVHLSQSAECETARDNGHNPGLYNFLCRPCADAFVRGEIDYGLPGQPCECKSVYKFGEKMTGRMLDGRTWDQVPVTHTVGA